MKNDFNIFILLDFLAENSYKFSEFFEVYDKKNQYYSIVAINPYLYVLKSTEKNYFKIKNFLENEKKDINFNLEEKSYRDLEFKNKKKKW